MNGFGERPKLWSPSEPSPSETGETEAPSNEFGSSVNAISFGFIATAIFISMFLVMAFFEHLVRPRLAFLHSRNEAQVSTAAAASIVVIGQAEDHLHSFWKTMKSQAQVVTPYTLDLSVVMPGQQHPTFLAQPAPLPCAREAIRWPPHDHLQFASPP